MILRHSIIGLPSGATYQLRFEQIGDVFPPGMVGNDIHPRALGRLVWFARDANCTVAKDDKAKAFVFIKRN
jgi:hypothetical protein